MPSQIIYRTTIQTLLCLGLLAASTLSALAAQEPRAQPLVLKEKIGEVDIQAYLPAGVTTYRGVIWHAMNTKFRTDDRWIALADELGFVRVVTSIDRRANNRPRKLRDALDQALTSWATTHGHPELPNLPLSGAGHSAGGMVLGCILRTPERALAVAIDCSWIADHTKQSEGSAKVPQLFTLGAIPDGFKMLPGIEQNFVPARAAGLPWGLGLQHGCAHDFGNAATLHVQWIRSVAALRLPADADARNGPVVLADIPLESGWLGDRDSINGQNATVAAWADYTGDRAAATWFPDRATALVWRAWQTKNAPIQLHMHREGWNLTAFQPKRSWNMPATTGTAVTLTIRIGEGNEAPTSVTWYSGDQVLAEAKAEPWEAVWTAEAGSHSIWAEWVSADGSRGTTNPALLSVSAARPQEATSEEP